MRSLACRSLRLDRDPVANILDIAVQEVSHFPNGRAERETMAIRRASSLVTTFACSASASLSRE
jgi:hypothetical protein